MPEFVYVGRSMERKGGNMLLDVFRSQFQGRARLNLVTYEHIAQPGPDVRVHSDFTPGDVRLQLIFSRSIAFILPTEADMSPNSIIEAMAAGLPVISTRQGGIPEMVLMASAAISSSLGMRGLWLRRWSRSCRIPSGVSAWAARRTSGPWRCTNSGRRPWN